MGQMFIFQLHTSVQPVKLMNQVSNSEVLTITHKAKQLNTEALLKL